MSTGVYEKTAGDLIREALRASTITGAEMPVEYADFANGQTALNDILSHWQAQGIHLWSETEAVLPLNPNQQSYTLGVNGDHCFSAYVYTTGLAALAGSTALDVVSTTGMTAGDNIGIELSTNVRQWTTIATVVDGNSLTLSAPLQASVDNLASIYTYTDLIDQPLRILSVRYSDEFPFDELPVNQVSREEYYEQPTKTTTGSATSWYYSRQLNAGLLSIWPVAARAENVLRFTFVKPQYIPTDQTDYVQIPAEWFLPLKWAVACELGTTYAIDPARQAVNEAKAANFLQTALDADVEVASFYVEPD